jgi:hypothetical protein
MAISCIVVAVWWPASVGRLPGGAAHLASDAMMPPKRAGRNQRADGLMPRPCRTFQT